MDYTIIPRTLIYRDKKNLDDFIEANELNAALVKNMADIDILLNRDFEQHALICMNAAYYICTIFMLEKHPVWRLSKLESYIDKLNLHPVAEFKDIIFSIVYLMLKHYNKKWLDNNRDLLEKIYVYIYPDLKNLRVRIEVSLEGGSRDIMQTLNTKLPNNFVLPDDEFAPRIIDCETVSEVKKQPCRWDIITDNFSKDKIRTIIGALAKTPEEERWVLEILINDVRNNVHISEAVASPKERMLQNMIDGIELYCLVMDDKKDENCNNIDETSPDVETAHPDEIDSLKQRIQELEAENKELKEQQPTGQPAEDDIESLKQQIADLEKEIADMEEREGLDAPKAALLVRIACSKLGSLPSNRENAWPLITNLWGSKESIAKRRLKESVRKSTVESLASLFESVAPKIARIIREEGKSIIEKQKKVKKQ